MKKLLNKKAFTLVEVVVTVVIIWILATISYMSFSGYTWEARDTARHKDLKTISNVLEYEISLGKELPEPDGNLVSESYEVAWKTYNFKTGEFGTNANNYFVGKLSALPVDPDSWAKYRYSLSEDGRYYILQATMDNGEVYKFSNLNDAGKGLVATVKTTTNGSNKNNSNNGNSEDEGDSVDNTPPIFWVQNWTVFNVVYGGYADMNQIIATDDRKWKINYSYNPTKINTLWDPRWYTENATITATDAAWNSSSVNIVFKIARKYTTPTWNKNNFSVVKLEKWQTVNHSDVKATDEIDWVLTVKRDKDVDVNKPGEYVVKYSAKNNWDVTSELVIKYVVWWDKSDLKFTGEDEFNCVTLRWGTVAVITGYKWTKKDIEIPTTCKWARVTTINSNVFKSKWLISVSWSSVKEIWPNAFENNNLTSVNFPEVTNIWDKAFSSNKLTSVSFPLVTNIWGYAFSGNNLTSVNFPLVTNILDSAFSSNNLTSVNFPLVTTIWVWVFENNNLTSVNFPLVTNIWDRAFSRNKLTSVSFPLVTNIWGWAFFLNQLTSVSFPLATDIWGESFQFNQLTSVNFPLATDIWGRAFYGNQLTSVNFPLVTKIWHLAFRENQLTSINFPEVTHILDQAFERNKLISFDFPKLKEIRSNAFKDNEFIEVNLPKTLIRIDRFAFAWNWVLKITNNSILTEDEIKKAFNRSLIREYNWEARN